MATLRNKKTPWETDLFSATLHELGHATLIELLGMEWRRCVVEPNLNYAPGKPYWFGHTTNRHGDQETPEETILIDIAGPLAQVLYEMPRITSFQAAWILQENRNNPECNGDWSFTHVRKCMRLLRGVWPSLLEEAMTWSAQLLIHYPSPNGGSLIDDAKVADLSAVEVKGGMNVAKSKAVKPCCRKAKAAKPPAPSSGDSAVAAVS